MAKVLKVNLWKERMESRLRDIRKIFEQKTVKTIITWLTI